jgi:NADH-quinone oxidoreductase subunit H
MWGLIERRIHVVFGLLIPILVRVAFFTVAERKVIAGVQRRHGPSVVGLWGLLQAIADGLKLVCKEMIFPAEARL